MMGFRKRRGVIPTGRQGFTVVEMLVVLGISAILSTMFIGHGSNLRGQLAIIQEEAKLMQVLLRAKTFSIQALANEDGEVACGYGIHVDSNEQEYFIFRKEKDLGDESCPDSDIGYEWNSEEEIIGGVKKFSDQISFSDTSNVVDIVFIPPKPDIKLIGVSEGTSEGKLVLCAKTGDFCRQVTVNRVGQVNSGAVGE